MSSKQKTGNQARNKINPARTKTESLFLLLPLLAVVTILPLIVKMYQYKTGLSKFDWYAATDDHFDFFLYYKQWFFVAISGFILLIICLRAFMDKKTLKFAPIFIPLGVYAALALLSTLVSEHSNFGFTGIYEQFENIYTLLGYALVVYYAFLIIRTEDEVKLMVDALAVGALILGTIGTFQAFGLDFFNSYIGKSMIVDQYTLPEEIRIVFGEGRTYGTLYNPNYVGVYTAFIIPMFSVLLIYSKKLYQYILYSLVILTSIISMFGSQSKAGFISILVAALFIVVFLRKKLFKKWMIVLPLLFIIIGSFFYINKINDNAYLNAIINSFKISKAAKPNLTSIETKDEGVYVTYKENEFMVTLDTTDNVINLTAVDSNYNVIDSTLAEDGYTYTFTDERFAGITMYPMTYDDILGFGLTIDGRDWYFTNLTGSNTYQYINLYGKVTKIETPETALFDGYENFASKRGYIWSRTIPLLKEHIFLGSGADTFVFAFPQNDYVGFSNYGYAEQLITKPHCLYLQMAVQTGVISLLAFLAFYLMYFVSSVKLYIKDQSVNSLAPFGIAIFVGTISYIVSAISNDSSISVAPVFWVMIGVGVTINHMIKDKNN